GVSCGAVGVVAFMPSWPAPWTQICPEASTYRRPLPSRLREPSLTEWRETRRTSSRIPCQSPWRSAGAAVRSRRSNASLRASQNQSTSKRRQREVSPACSVEINSLHRLRVVEAELAIKVRHSGAKEVIDVSILFDDHGFVRRR